MQEARLSGAHAGRNAGYSGPTTSVQGGRQGGRPRPSTTGWVRREERAAARSWVLVYQERAAARSWVHRHQGTRGRAFRPSGSEDVTSRLCSRPRQ
jgi:hypothetical protein